jgi:hypothetical protein
MSTWVSQTILETKVVQIFGAANRKQKYSFAFCEPKG